MCECVYFTSHPFTVFCSGSDFDGPLPHAHVVTAAKLDPQTLGVCFTCLFSQESRILPFILPPPSVFYCLQRGAAEMSGVRWGSRYKKCMCVCVCVHTCIRYVCRCRYSVAQTNAASASTVCFYVVPCVLFCM